MGRKKAAKVVSSAILGMDFKTIIVNGKVYIITRHFVGSKNAGEVISQLALSKALSETLKKK